VQLLPLLQLLSDGKFHSGDELGKSLGVSRAAVWKSSKKITELGLDLHSVKGKGYRLNNALQLLNNEALLAGLADFQKEKIVELELLSSVDSTNSHAMRRIQNDNLDLAKGKVLVCLAEQQASGKGRRGREWVSPFGRNMYLSLVREFDSGAVGLEGLSLVVGLALVRALESVGIAGLGLKWPNDVLWQGRKLAGILLEMSGDVTGACQVVIGVGLNIHMDVEERLDIGQPWVDLKSIESSLPERNSLIARVIEELLVALDQFEENGFADFMQEWEKVDVLKGFQVELRRSLLSEVPEDAGVAKGVDAKGALLIQTDSGLQSFHGGEVSVRKQVLNDS
jgi:BirA family biotin operon repressor/biotin-[acetyl-CoA-carboxylase] ligase